MDPMPYGIRSDDERDLLVDKTHEMAKRDNQMDGEDNVNLKYRPIKAAPVDNGANLHEIDTSPWT